MTMPRLLGGAGAVLLGLVAAGCGSEARSPLSATPQPSIIALSLLPGTFPDAAVGDYSAVLVRIENKGTSPFTYTSVAVNNGAFQVLAPGNGIYFTSDVYTPSGTVAPGGTMSAQLTFRPSSPIRYNATVTVTSNASSGTNTIAVSGTGRLAYLLTAIIGDSAGTACSQYGDMTVYVDGVSIGTAAFGSTITKVLSVGTHRVSGRSSAGWTWAERTFEMTVAGYNFTFGCG